MQKINQLKLSGILTDPGNICVLGTTGDHAINFKIDFPFGNKKCQMFGTAYKDTADKISQIVPGTEIVMEGALYTESYKTKSGNANTIAKIRATKVSVQDNDQ
jgi:hypothetical protein